MVFWWSGVVVWQELWECSLALDVWPGSCPDGRVGVYLVLHQDQEQSHGYEVQEVENKVDHLVDLCLHR